MAKISSRQIVFMAESPESNPCQLRSQSSNFSAALRQFRITIPQWLGTGLSGASSGEGLTPFEHDHLWTMASFRPSWDNRVQEADEWVRLAPSVHLGRLSRANADAK